MLVTQSCLTLQPHRLHTARQAPLSMEFSRQEYWSGWTLSSPSDLPDPGIKPRSPALQAESLPTEPMSKSSSGEAGEGAQWTRERGQWQEQGLTLAGLREKIGRERLEKGSRGNF